MLLRIIIVACVMVGISSQVFAISLEGAVNEHYKALKGMEGMFDTNGKVSNIYSSALKLIKDDEVKITFEAVEKIMDIHGEFADCGISKTDVLNVLYDSNTDFRAVLEQTVLKGTKKKVDVPATNDISKSYKRLIGCRTMNTKILSTDFYENVRNILNKNYNYVLPTLFRQSTAAEANFKEDLYLNGTLDDSDYDLIVDIDNIGKKFFLSFTSPPTMLFYEMPTLGPGGGGGSPGGGGGPGGIYNSSNPVSTTGAGIKTGTAFPYFTGGGNSGSSGGKNALSDPRLNTFIQQTNTLLRIPENLSPVQGSQCISGVSADLQLPNESLMTPEEYNEFIRNALHTISVLPEGIIPDAFDLGSPNYPSGGSTESGAIDQYIENTIDTLGSDCAQQCLVLPAGLKENCQNKCLETCFETCDTNYTNPGDNALCKIQCSCFKVSGPTGEPWASKDMEDMYKVQFCTVPVEQGKARGGKKVYSIEAIFTELRTVFTSLLTQGGLFKRTPTKEFFDTSFKELKFSDVLSFQVTFGFKPLFANISESSIKKEQKQQLTTYESAILGTEPDNKNKYIVVSNVAQNRVESEYVGSLEEWNKNIEEIQQIETNSNYLQDVIKTASNKKVGQGSEEILNFVVKNIEFRNQTLSNMNTMAGYADILKKKIDSEG